MPVTERSVQMGPPAHPRTARPIDELVLRWATRTPDAPAVRWRGRDTSYRELAEQLRTVAGNLVDLGVCPGDRVAVHLGRGPEQVAVLLGILAAGGVYAGAGITWPAGRFRSLIADSGAVLAVTENGPLTARMLLTGAPRSTAHGRTGADPCCVFYTSGSSGTPRAVLSPHAGTVRLAYDGAFGFADGMRMPQVSPIGWDAHSLELWVPLLRGGTTVLYDGTHPDSTGIRDVIHDGVDTMFAATSLFHALVEDDVAAFAGLRMLIVGGERLAGEDVRRFRAAHPRIRLINGYGPVEATVFASVYEVAHELAGDPPIGRPICGTDVYLLDAKHEPVPDGTPGQIALAGTGVATGYLNDAAATRARFRTLPLGPGGGPVRVYLTGDRACLDERDDLVFLGRTDREFKLRGTRISPEEIETAMENVPGVVRAVAFALPLTGDPKTAVCGVVVADRDAGDGLAERVHAELTDRLPAAFVPARVLRLDALPLTANGKTDVVRLAELATAPTNRPAVVDDGLPPAVRDLVLAAGDLLGAAVGADTDLFSAGATSLTAIRLVARLHERLPLTVGHVLSGRTPARIAELVAEGSRPDPRPRPDTASRRWVGAIPITQYRMWYLHHMFPGTGDTVNPMVHRIRGPLDAAAVRAAVRAVTGWHEALRTVLRCDDGRHVEPHVVPAGEIGELVDTAAVTEDELPAALSEIAATAFDLAQDLPIRGRLLRLAEEDHVLAITIAHTAGDGWSEVVFARQLAEAYAAITAGRPLPQRTLPSFTEVARRQSDRADTRDEQFWIEHLRGVPDLPLGPVPPEPVGPVGEARVDLDGIDQDRLAGVCARYATTTAAVYLAAWVLALRAETGAGDFALGMPMAGRTVAEAEDVVGCFASSAILRFTGVDCLTEAAALLRRLAAGQFMPLERMFWELAPPETGRRPFCQVGFALQNIGEEPLRLPGTAVERVRVPQPTSAFELALELWPRSDFGGYVWYRTDVIPAGRARRLARLWREHLNRLLGEG